jgi:hypothetical protein
LTVAQIFYTLQIVLPLLATVEDPYASFYKALAPDEVESEAAAGLRRRLQLTEPVKASEYNGAAVSPNIKAMLRLLYSIRKPYSLFRGFGWALLYTMLKIPILVASSFIGGPLGFIFQILAPLALVQLDTLWVHATISQPSSKPFMRRIVPIEQALRSLAAPTILAQAAQAVTQRIMTAAFNGMGMKWEDVFMMETNAPARVTWFFLLLTLLSVVLIAPSRLAMLRVQASLLPGSEHSIITLDQAISAARDEELVLTFGEALKSIKLQTLVNLAFLYFKILLVTWGLVMVFGTIDFMWFFILAMTGWKF